MSRVQTHGILLIILLAGLTVVGQVAMSDAGDGKRPRLEGWVPLQLAGWRGEQYTPPDAWKEQLPHARFLVRYYFSEGARVELLMIESADPGDFHSPMFCLPGNGWTPKESGVRKLKHGSVSQAEFNQDFASLTVRYWYLAGDKLSATLSRHKWNMAVNKLTGKGGPNFSFRVTVRERGARQPAAIANEFSDNTLKALGSRLSKSRVAVK